jgi:hypothetical protein
MLSCGYGCGQGPEVNPFWFHPSGGGGQTNTPACVYYVSTSGSDSNDGLAPTTGGGHGPFLTFAHTLSVTRTVAQAYRVVCVRAGTYTATMSDACNWTTALLTLNNTNDTGSVWQYYAPDGYNTAILDGQSTANDGICLSGSISGIKINGLQVQNLVNTGIRCNTCNGVVLKNNIIHDVYTIQGNTGMGITVDVGLNTQITHNALWNISDMGIGQWAKSNNGNDNLLIDHNYVRNSCDITRDCGGIYIENNQALTQSNQRVQYNYVHDCGAGGGCNPYYLDDRTSSITLTGNVATGRMWDCGMMHGGSNNIWTGHICDLADGLQPVGAAMQIIVSQGEGSTMSGNSITGSIIIVSSSRSNAGGGYYCNGPPCQLSAGPNQYYNYGSGGSVNSDSSFPDSNPQYADPKLSTWCYVVEASAPELGSPVNYSAQPSGWGEPGFWGPPGFTIPQTGNAPSNPHSTACPSTSWP